MSVTLRMGYSNPAVSAKAGAVRTQSTPQTLTTSDKNVPRKLTGASLTNLPAQGNPFLAGIV